MKDKILQIRIEEELLTKIKHLQWLNGYKSVSETIRKTMEKEYRREIEQNK